jgi:hypothetical protein
MRELLIALALAAGLLGGGKLGHAGPWDLPLANPKTRSKHYIYIYQDRATWNRWPRVMRMVERDRQEEARGKYFCAIVFYY